MIQEIQIDSELADEVSRELHSVRVRWEYLGMTTKFFDGSNEEQKKEIAEIRKNYPVIDSQKFSENIYNEKTHRNPFISIRRDPKSRYNTVFPFTAKLIDAIQQKHIPSTYKVARIITNMQTIRPAWTINAIHPDMTHKDFISVLYYANDSDGDTFFFEGSECVYRKSPVKGTAVIYPSSMLHAGSTPTKTETRVVINMVFAPKNITLAPVEPILN